MKLNIAVGAFSTLTSIPICFEQYPELLKEKNITDR